MQEDINVLLLPFCKGCRMVFRGMGKRSKLKDCPNIKKYGFYYTPNGERIQRYMCAKTCQTFTKYTADKINCYMQNRNKPFKEIKIEYEDMPHTLSTLSTKYNISVSTIRTILKRCKNHNID